MAIALEPGRTYTAEPPSAAPTISVWHAYAVSFAALCVMVGVYWDISWHMSIGRDSFWTPAHLVIQAGGLIAGLSSGYVALKTTFRGSDAERAASVGFWGFRAPFGAWICIWGCGAMLTSAPFDNWWHNAYGLDVQIVSPPHTVLALGIFAIVVGALMLTMALQNRASGAEARRLALLVSAVGGLFIMNFAVFITEYSERMMLHGTLFYQIVCVLFPFALCGLSRAGKLDWSATVSAAAFMALMLVLMWTIEQFPATPKLGPIYQHIGHMVSLSWPLWLVAPAAAIDWLRRRLDGRVSTATLAAVLGAAFLAAFMAVEWPFASFLVLNPAARGGFFNGNNYVYWASNAYVARTHEFIPAPAAAVFARGLAIALVYAIVSSGVGLLWGRRLTAVRR
jgi:hypothetical protein